MATIKLRLHDLLRQREDRENRRIRLTEIAQATGIPVETLTPMINNEVDQVSLDALAKLASYFHCQPGELLQYQEQASDIEDVVDVREIEHKWHREYGADEHPPE